MQQIADWLKNIGLEQYAQRFAENDIDMSVLRYLNDQDLEKIGVSLGHRRKIMVAIGGTAPAEPQPAVPEPKQQEAAERRQLTVMFCDLVGSTALSVRLDPEDLREIIGSYHRCCAELVERNGGFIAKYMGDGVLSYFGYPQAHEHDAERAIRAGLALVGAVPKLKTAADVPLQARVGIATGLVVVGDLLGAGASQEQAVVGETPNLAARLQTLAEPGNVVIASTTRNLTAGLFDYRDLGTVPLKGFDEGVPAWQVIGPSAAESRFEAFHSTALTPLVGRDEEVDLLMRRWQQAKAGDGSVVLISGEPGIGKSRITQAVQDRLGTEPHTHLRYFCSPHHQDSALYPVIAQLERAAGFRRDDTVEQRLNKLETVLAQATNDLGEAAPLLADLLSIPTGDRYPPLNLSPQKQKQMTLKGLVGQVEALGAQQPVLMVFEDAHWSDPTSREVLDLIVDRVSSLRVLLIVTFRPEFTPPWVGRPEVTLLSLSRLPPRLRADMITRVVEGKALPKEIVDQIIERTDGIPLFIEELTKAVVETGVVAQIGDRYQVTGPLTPLAIPTSLHASLLARLDRLAPVREVAQIAAAIGRQFSHELISVVASMLKQKLDDALEQLVTAELIFRRGTPPDAEYTFKHALVQDAAYSTLLRSRRQQIHARITTTLEEKFPEVVAVQPELLAHHCAQAGLIEEAIGYWLKAGQQSVARSTFSEAVLQLQKGLDLLSGLPDSSWRQQQELDLQVALGPARIATSGFSASDVGETYARARTLAEQLDRPEYVVSLLYGQWAFHCVRSEYKLALSLAEQLEQIGETRNDIAASLLGHFAHGATCLWRGEFVAARALFEQCHGMTDPAHRSLYVAMTGTDQYLATLSELAMTLTFLGHVEQGRARVKQALSAARKLGHAHSLGFVLTFACQIEWTTGGPQDAKRHAEEMVTLSNEHGFALWLSWGALWCGGSLTALGQPQQGLSQLTEGLSMVRAVGDILGTPWALMMLAGTYAKLGQLEKGLKCLAEAAQIIEMTDERYGEAELHRLRGDLLNATGNRALAEQSYHRSLAVARRQSAKFLELRTATSLARLWRDQGKSVEARDLLAPVYNWFTEGHDTPVLKEAKALLDQLA
jgi:class 3 adenylate cyclase/predicted ATPase